MTSFTISTHSRHRPTLSRISHEANLRRAQERLQQITSEITAGTFRFLDAFPSYRGRRTLRVPLKARTCADVFDAFLHHEAARVARGDLAPVTLTAHRQLLDHVCRPAIGSLRLLEVRYSKLVAMADTHHWTKKTYNNAISVARSTSASRTIPNSTTQPRH